MNFTVRHQNRQTLIAVASACRSYHFKTYRQCFVGSNAVQWLLSAGFADDAAEAVQMGNDMLHLGLLHHVKHEHAFENRLGSDLVALHQCCPPLLSTRVPCCRYLFYRWACRSGTHCRP